MRYQSDKNKAESMFEMAMENVHGHARDAERAVEELALLIDELVVESERDKVDDLISRVLACLDRIG